MFVISTSDIGFTIDFHHKGIITKTVGGIVIVVFFNINLLSKTIFIATIITVTLSVILLF